MTQKVKNVVNVVVLNLIVDRREGINYDKPASAGTLQKFIKALKPYGFLIIRLMICWILSLTIKASLPF
ncbi:MAG TPA: hypothetical protein VK959_05230 [Methylophilaceae bacterium]|nr:hypothetical protein [Methylophilaceae bacterium]